MMEDGIGKMEWPTATGNTDNGGMKSWGTPRSPGDKPTPVRTKVARIETLHRTMEAAENFTRQKSRNSSAQEEETETIKS